MPTIAERRANAVLALIDARRLMLELTPYPDIERRRREQFDAAVAEYGAAHAPTADEIKTHLLEHVDTDVTVGFESGQVTVSVGLEWYDDQGSHPLSIGFGHDQDSDHDNQCIGECC